MKYTLVFFSAFIALALCNLSFLENPRFDFLETVEDKDQIQPFFEGLFSYFNLSRPTQIIDCFNNVNSELFFKLLYEINDLLTDTNDRNNFQLHIDYIKLKLLMTSLRETHACVFITQDFTNLLDALEVPDRNPTLFGYAAYIYYQASFPELSRDFKTIIDDLEFNHFDAGRKYGSILLNLVGYSHKVGLGLLSFRGFSNGAAVVLDLDYPFDGIQCYNDTSATYMLKFLYRLSVSVSNGNFLEAPYNALKFWRKGGKAILEKIPMSVVKCNMESEDHKKLIDKLGIDISTEDFFDLMQKYINNNRLMFYTHMKAMRTAFDNANLIHAGNIYGNLVKAIASTKDS